MLMRCMQMNEGDGWVYDLVLGNLKAHINAFVEYGNECATALV